MKRRLLMLAEERYYGRRWHHRYGYQQARWYMQGYLRSAWRRGNSVQIARWLRRLAILDLHHEGHVVHGLCR